MSQPVLNHFGMDSQNGTTRCLTLCDRDGWARGFPWDRVKRLSRSARLCISQSFVMRRSEEHVDPETGEVVTVRKESVRRTGGWRCPRCAETTLKRDQGRLYTGIRNHDGPLAFARISLPGHLHGDQGAAYSRLRDRWPQFMHVLAREMGRFAYWANTEEHKSGIPHRHALLGGEVGHAISTGRPAGVLATLQYAADRARLGLVHVHRRPVLPGSPRRVHAYLNKVPSLPVGAPDGWRRVVSSRSFLPPRPRATSATPTGSWTPLPGMIRTTLLTADGMHQPTASSRAPATAARITSLPERGEPGR